MISDDDTVDEDAEVDLEKETTETSRDDAPQNVLEGEYLDLPHGKDFDDHSARLLTISRPVRTIVIAGPVSSGKTTLLLSMYELFLKGSMPGWLFSGCGTLHGFEQRCHPSRIESNRAIAHTERTLTNREDGVRYLHLKMSRETEPDAPLDFLFTDLTGEIYEEASHSTEVCKELEFVAICDHFVVLIDGERLSSKLTRHSAIQEASTLVRTMLDSNVLGSQSFIRILLTKADAFAPTASAADLNSFRVDAVDYLRTQFGDRVASLTFSEVAARPSQASEVPFGQGIVELLDHWASVGPRERSMQLNRSPSACLRESQAFFYRHFRHL